MKNDEDRWRIFTKSLTEMSRKCLGLDFFHENNFPHKFRENPKYQKVCSTLLPLFIEEKKEVVAAQASWVASTRRHRLLLEPLEGPSGSGCYLHPPLFTKYTSFLLNTPPFVFFCWFLPETLWNFTDYVTTPIFFLECCETLRITQQCPFWLPKCCGTLRIVQQCFLSTSKML